MSYNLQRRLAAEFIGTCFLLMTVIGSGIMAESLADGNVALALLGNTLPTGAILVVLIMWLGPISGAHFNPAVTLAFRIRHEISTLDAAYYVMTQIVAGILGAVLAHLMFELAPIDSSSTIRTGLPQYLSEVIATFGLVAVILGTLVSRPQAVPYAVGLYITAAYWFTASTSFANPAVTIARTLTDTFSGIRLIDAPMFILAQLVGAILATFVLGWLMKGDATSGGSKFK